MKAAFLLSILLLGGGIAEAQAPRGSDAAALASARAEARAAAERSERLEAQGVDVRSKVWNGSTHEFFGMGLVVPDAAAAQTFAAHELKRAFGTAILPI